jgi:mono/diheme cytochrome c family protein
MNQQHRQALYSFFAHPISADDSPKGVPMIKIAAFFSLVFSIIALDAAAAADANHGRQVARRWCVTCHVVAANQRQTTSEAPPFAAIARKPDFDVNRLATFLMNPYPRMPAMSLTRVEAQDIAAYIATLRR